MPLTQVVLPATATVPISSLLKFAIWALRTSRPRKEKSKKTARIFSTACVKSTVKDLDNIFLYLHIDGIPPVADRDVVVKAEMWQDPISMEMSMEGHSVDNGMPVHSGIVRIPDMTAGFRVKPISPTVTEIELSGSVDPGGAIPIWASNMLITVLPRLSLDNLRAKLAKPDYREYLRAGRDKDARWSRLFHDFRFTTPTASN